MSRPDPFGLRINLALHHVVWIEARYLNDGGVGITLRDDRGALHQINAWPDDPHTGPLVMEHTGVLAKVSEEGG